MKPARAEVPRRSRIAPAAMDAAALISIYVAAALAGQLVFRLTHLRGAEASSATGPLRWMAVLSVASLLLYVAARSRREKSRRDIALAAQRAAVDYAAMMRRTASVERQLYGDVLSFPSKNGSNRRTTMERSATSPQPRTDQLSDSPNNRNGEVLMGGLNSPLPDSVLIRYHVEHPEELLSSDHEYLRKQIEDARAQQNARQRVDRPAEPVTDQEPAPVLRILIDDVRRFVASSLRRRSSVRHLPHQRRWGGRATSAGR